MLLGWLSSSDPSKASAAAAAAEADLPTGAVTRNRTKASSRTPKPAGPSALVAGGKHRPAEEEDVHVTEDVMRRRSGMHSPPMSAKGTARKSARIAAASRAGGSHGTATFTSRSKASARSAATTAREQQDEQRALDAIKSARESARRSARRATARFHENPLPTSAPPPQEWRRWPSGAPQKRDVNNLWANATKAHIKGAAAVAAFAKAGDATAPSTAPTSDGEPLAPPRGTAGSIKPEFQYGSRRALSERERGFQQQGVLHRRAREQLSALKAKAREEEARQELETKRKRIEQLRARQRSARGTGQLTKADRAKSQERLYAVSARRRQGAVYC